MEIRIDTISSILESIGCKSDHQPKGQGWHRVFIHLPQPDGIPVSLGRVMFKHGEYKWVKWYSPPVEGDLQDWDVVWFDWHMMLMLGRRMGDQMWQEIRHAAVARARQEFELKKEARAQLNETRKAEGKKVRTGKLAPPNPRRAACKIMSEYITTELGREVTLFAL